MIQNIKFGFYSVALCLSLLFCASCSLLDGTDLYSGFAEMTLTNVTTGESRTEQGAVVYIGDGDPKAYHFKRGDVMRLGFTPPKEYEKSKFSVVYEIFDIIATVTERPYEYELTVSEDIPVGTYSVTCSAMCEKWMDSSSCSQTMTFRVDE